MKTATLKCNLPQFEQPLHTAAARSPSLSPLCCPSSSSSSSSRAHLGSVSFGALPSSAAFSLAFYFPFFCCCLSYLLLPPFARLAHLNVFSWHLHRHSIRLISFSCHSQWVDESLGCLDYCSSPARVLVCGCLLLCGAATVCGEDLAAHAFF